MLWSTCCQVSERIAWLPIEQDFDFCPGPAILYNPIGWWHRQIGPPQWDKKACTSAMTHWRADRAGRERRGCRRSRSTCPRSRKAPSALSDRHQAGVLLPALRIRYASFSTGHHAMRVHRRSVSQTRAVTPRQAELVAKGKIQVGETMPTPAAFRKRIVDVC